jgi:hypothetical protein
MKTYRLLLLLLALTFVPYVHFVSTPLLRYLFEMQDMHAASSNTFAYQLVSAEYWFLALAPMLLTLALMANMIVDMGRKFAKLATKKL